MNADLIGKAKSFLKNGISINRHKMISDLLAECERLRGVEDQAHGEGIIAGERIAALERENAELKRSVWNHEGVSKDYTLMVKKVKHRDERIAELERACASVVIPSSCRDSITTIGGLRVKTSITQPVNRIDFLDATGNIIGSIVHSIGSANSGWRE